MKHILNIIKGIPVIVLCAAVTGCTGDFEEYNTNPYGPTLEDMAGDNQLTGTYLNDMMIALCQIQQNNSQWVEQFVGGEYGAMTTPARQWSNGADWDFAAFNPTPQNCSQPFEIIMPQISTGYFQLRDVTNGEGEVFAIATIVRAAATLRLCDTYGPMPYSKVNGESFHVAYDREEDLYDYLLADLNKAIETLSAQAANNVVNGTIAENDAIFGGNYNKWVKFANTVKLRMAIRMKTVKPSLAQQVVQEVQNDVVGTMKEADDSAWTYQNDGMNPFHRAAYTWNGGTDLSINANIVLYLNGYNDPRLTKYATYSSSPSGYWGVYPGKPQGEPGSNTLHNQLSDLNISTDDPQLIMSASEAYFLKAEAALAGWWTKDSAKDLYEAGIRVSMQERGCDIGSYLSQGAPGTLTYNAARSTGSIGSAPAVAVSGSSPTIQQIVTQKWLANFPNGWETWVDIRRTNYPSLLPAVTRSRIGVTSINTMRRLTFSNEEYSLNKENIDAAVQLLKDPSDAFTSRLWWQE